MEKEEILKLAAYVLVSSYRERVIISLHEHGILIPKTIASTAGFRQNHVSTVLNQLKSKRIVECLNPEARKGRLYRLTPVGEEVYKALPSLKGENLNDRLLD